MTVSTTRQHHLCEDRDTHVSPNGYTTSGRTTICRHLDDGTVWKSSVIRNPDGTWLQAVDRLEAAVGDGWWVRVMWSTDQPAGNSREFAEQLRSELVEMDRDEVGVAELAAYERDSYDAGTTLPGRGLGERTYVPRR